MNEWIYVVDSEAETRHAISRTLSENRMRASCFCSAEEALHFLEACERKPELILLNRCCGFDALRRMRTVKGAESIPILFMLDGEELEAECRALEAGAMDCIRKPFALPLLLARVRHAIELTRLQTALERQVQEKARAIIDKQAQLARLSMQVVETLAGAVDAKDTYTNGHSRRVAVYAREIARRYGYSQERADRIYTMGLLHDIGKIGIPDSIITKSGALTDEEYALAKTHPELGARILAKFPEFPELAIGAHWHHERFDGKGYPDGIAGADIPEEARMIAVADSYDAMASRRSYRDVLPQAEVRAEIAAGRGTQFDPTFADIMLEMIDEDKDYRMRQE